jgi:hypothetical protein
LIVVAVVMMVIVCLEAGPAAEGDSYSEPQNRHYSISIFNLLGKDMNYRQLIAEHSKTRMFGFLPGDAQMFEKSGHRHIGLAE